MRVKKVTTDKKETSATIDLFSDVDVPLKVRRKIQDNVGDYLLEQTLQAVGDKKSPIEGGGDFPPLKKGPYRKKKLDEIGNTEANLEFSGTMLDELDYKKDEDGIVIGVFGDAAPRADGHNNLSGDSNLPLRKFLPGEGESYKSDIEETVDQIIQDTIAEETEITKDDLDEVGTKDELYAVFEDKFGLDISRNEMKLIVLRNSDIVDLLNELDLLDLL